MLISLLCLGLLVSVYTEAGRGEGRAPWMRRMPPMTYKPRPFERPLPEPDFMRRDWDRGMRRGGGGRWPGRREYGYGYERRTREPSLEQILRSYLPEEMWYEGSSMDIAPPELPLRSGTVLNFLSILSEIGLIPPVEMVVEALQIPEGEVPQWSKHDKPKHGNFSGKPRGRDKPRAGRMDRNRPDGDRRKDEKDKKMMKARQVTNSELDRVTSALTKLMGSMTSLPTDQFNRASRTIVQFLPVCCLTSNATNKGAYFSKLVEFAKARQALTSEKGRMEKTEAVAELSKMLGDEFLAIRRKWESTMLRAIAAELSKINPSLNDCTSKVIGQVASNDLVREFFLLLKDKPKCNNKPKYLSAGGVPYGMPVTPLMGAPGERTQVKEFLWRNIGGEIKNMLQTKAIPPVSPEAETNDETPPTAVKRVSMDPDAIARCSNESIFYIAEYLHGSESRAAEALRMVDKFALKEYFRGSGMGFMGSKTAKDVLDYMHPCRGEKMKKEKDADDDDSAEKPRLREHKPPPSTGHFMGFPPDPYTASRQNSEGQGDRIRRNRMGTEEQAEPARGPPRINFVPPSHPMDAGFAAARPPPRDDMPPQPMSFGMRPPLPRPGRD